MPERPSRRRFLVGAGALSGQTVKLPADQAHHLRVMRLAVGQIVQLFDGTGAEASAEVLDPETALLRVLTRLPAGGETLHTCLVQAVPVKLPRMDTIVQQCTELGVSRIVPVLSARGQVPGGGAASVQGRVERWQRVATAAAKQCGRSGLPRIDAPVRLADLDLAALPTPRLLLHRSGGAIEHAAVNREVTLMVGPEGGWSEDEVAGLVGGGALVVGLGPRTLRADTAGVVALALAQHLWGDLQADASVAPMPSDTP